jgi:hypothetical protein
VNAYQEVQSSGIHWPARTAGLLYQPLQAAPAGWPEPRQHGAVFEGLERQMADFAVDEAAALAEVRRYFVLPADASVSTFLSGHRAITQILLEAAVQLRACFAPTAVFNLRAPIDESGSQTLYVVAMWPGSLQDVRRALATFDDTWWFAHSRRALGYLAFTYELV